jgi:FtsP/CotA-like multicopper oxidase with cupredoxin domain
MQANALKYAFQGVAHGRSGLRHRRIVGVQSAVWALDIRMLGAALGAGAMLFSPAIAADVELMQPPVCSTATAIQLKDVCEVKPLGGGKNEIKLNLTAASATISIGGYKVVTENYNGNYLAPIVEAMPGDTVSARLVNMLMPKPGNSGPNHGGAHAAMAGNPTNLHYFHGGIVTPNNARPKAAEKGDGDNVYVLLQSGRDASGNPNSFDYKVPIPGEMELDARVLEGAGRIAHPVGLNWYHSHMHGISAGQVAGGMSGLLSVGEADANVKAACVKDPTDPNNPTKCLNNVDSDTRDLKARTNVRYALMRDVALQVTKRPDQADGDTATLDPNFAALTFPPNTPCGVFKADGSGLDDNVKLRAGFCQRNPGPTLLFTLNGQRFPTITVEGGRNLLLRLGNLSSNIPYWLELTNEADGTVLPLTLLSLDGVVPALPARPDQAAKPVQALNNNDLLLMPAARAEIYVRNDEKPHDAIQNFVLRAKKHKVGSEEWPEVQLARIVLQPNAAASKTLVALNVPQAREFAQQLSAQVRAQEDESLPSGCVRDLNRASREFRRITFAAKAKASDGRMFDWGVLTEIVKPDGTEPKDQTKHIVDPAETIAQADGKAVPFEEYVLPNGLVDWEGKLKKHVCIKIDHDAHLGSHKQLWVLVNGTPTLHNFHIHQMKFRLATRRELQDEYSILPPESPHTCGTNPCAGPNYELYDDSPPDLDPGATRRWHDTIPVPPLKAVFVVMSFDAKQQIGRFVFHCHILKHEDSGLMAPIEVWEPTALAMNR